MTPRRTDYPTRKAQAEALAALVAAQLSEALAERKRAALALSGGDTPGPFMEVLSQADLDWSRVDVTLSDEFIKLAEAFGYGIDDVEWLTINAMKSAFWPFEQRLRIINEQIKPRYAALRAAGL